MDEEKPPGDAGKFAEKIGHKEERRLRAFRERGISPRFWLGMLGLVGWAVTVPILLCIALGIWLDSALPLGFSWTLTFLVIGVIIGCINAWYWIKRESGID
jgi:ATP synthase protein I